MAKRSTSNIERRETPPIQKIMSSLPQFGIALSLLFFINHNAEGHVNRGFAFHIASLAAVTLSAVFCYLQITRASYRNWQANPKTRQAIQLASVAALISFIGYHIAMWGVYGWFTPVVILSGAVFVLTFLLGLTALVSSVH